MPFACSQPSLYPHRAAESSKVTGLTRRAFAGTAWSALSSVGKQMLTLASLATVARILGPSAYGLMGMASLVIAFIGNFRDLGTASAVVQRPTVSKALLSSLFWINVAMGAVMFLLLCTAAPAIARFFGSPELANILRVLAASLFLASCGVVHGAILNREMSFKTLAVIDLTAGVITYFVALAALTGDLACGRWYSLA